MEDNLILYGTSLLVIVLIFILKLTKKVKIINLCIFILYTIYMQIKWVYFSESGEALAYWFYLICLNIFHSVLLLIQWMLFKKVHNRIN